MGWRTRDDLGTQIVGHVYDAMKVSDGWSINFDRGFSWWADDFCQTVWSDMGLFQNAQNMFRIHAETDLFRGRGHAQDFELALTSAMRDSTFNSVVFDTESDTYKLHCSVYVTADNAHFMDRLFMAACALQVAEASEMGHHLAKQVGAPPATSGHPKHGLRSHPDPMVKCIETFFKPHGVQASRWIGVPEWKQMEWAMERQSQRFECDHSSRMHADFYWSIPQPDGNVACTTLEVKTDEAHPILGHGLMFRLKLPIKMSPQKVAHTAVALNNLERKEWLRAQFMGSWCYDDGALEFECFVPNTCYHVDILEAISLSMAIRAEWANEQFGRWFAAAKS